MVIVLFLLQCASITLASESSSFCPAGTKCSRCIETQPQPSSIKVMTYNIAWENTKQTSPEDFQKEIFKICQEQMTDSDQDSCKKRVAKRIRIHIGYVSETGSHAKHDKAKVDILGIQEATFIDDVESLKSWNLYDMVFPNGVKHYEASVYVRKGRHASAGIVTFYDSEKFEFIAKDTGGLGPKTSTRVYLVTYLRHKLSRQVFVHVNIHAPRDGLEQDKMIREIWKKIKRKFPVMNLIVAGDFNEGSSQTIKKGVKFFEFGFALHEPENLKPTCCFTTRDGDRFHLKDPYSILSSESAINEQNYDHIMSNIPFMRMLPYGAYEKQEHNENFEDVLSPTEHTVESDHLPIVADIRFNFFQETTDKMKHILKKYWMKFYFVRHGESIFNKFNEENARRVSLGYNLLFHYENPESEFVDAPLSEEGYRQAQEAGDVLTYYGLKKDTTIVFASPLERAQATARTLGYKQEEIIVDNDLVEITNFADGMTKDEWTWKNVAGATQSKPTEAGYFLPLFERMIKEALRKDADTIVIIGHSQWFQSLAQLITGKKLQWLESSWKIYGDQKIGNAEIVEFEYDYTSHLGGEKQLFWNRFYCHPKKFVPKKEAASSSALRKRF